MSTVQHTPCPHPHPHPRGRGSTWARRGKNGGKCVWYRGEPPLAMGGQSPRPNPSPDKRPGKRLPGRPGAHPRRRPATCAVPGRRLRPGARPRAGRPPGPGAEREPPPGPSRRPSIQPEPGGSPSPGNFAPLTTPWTRNSKSLLFVALRAPPATSSAAIGVGSVAPLTLSLSFSFFPFSAFFSLQLSPLSPAGRSHTSTRAEWGGGPFRAALTAHGPRRRRRGRRIPAPISPK